MCLMHSEAKQYLNVRVESRERFIAGLCKEMSGSCLKEPELSKRFQQIPFKDKERKGLTACHELLVLDPLLL